MRIVRFLLLLAALLCAPLACAQTFPKLTGRVVDGARLLDPAQAQTLTAKLAALEKDSGRQLVVATVPDLQGQDISDYAYQLGRTWGIGQKGKNDGAILLVAPAERKMWITVGYGLEGILTDALTSRIYRNAIVPRFKARDYPGGINAGVDQIAELLRLPPDEAARRAADAAKAERSGGDKVNAGMVIFWLVIILVFILPLARRFGGGGGRRYGRSGMAPVILWGPGLGGWGDTDRGGGSGWGGFGGGDSGGFSGGGGSFGGGGAGGSW